MEELRQYVFSVIAAALICGVIVRLSHNGGNCEIVKLLCGVFMTIVLILPLSGKRMNRWADALPEIEWQAEAIVSDGVSAAGRIEAEIIKQRTEAYILDRAAALDADIVVTVSLDQEEIPNHVRITGSVSPLNRSRLTSVIASELGIPREQQEWIG